MGTGTTTHKRRSRLPSGRLQLLVLGVLTTLLLASGVFALISDTITVPGNNLESGTYTAPSGTQHDLQIAVLGTAANCSDDANLTWSDSNTVTASFGAGTTVDLQTHSGSLVTGAAFCLRNNSDTSGHLTVQIDPATYTDLEVGTCQGTESAAGDATCDDGGAGELGSLLNLRWVGVDTFGAYNGTLSATPYTLATGWGLDSRLQVAAGYFFKSSLTDTALLTGQTDRIQFDMVFTLEDISAS